MNYFRHTEKLAAQRKAEQDGLVSDSMEVRLALVEKLHSEEITPAQLLSQLKKIKRDGKKNGKITRAQAYTQG